MAEYIDRKALLELINEDCKYQNPTNEYTRGCNEVCDWAIKTIKNMPATDVVPKSEVDNWYQLYHSIKEELKQEKIYHRETEKLCDRYCIESQQAKKQVTREIFEEISKASADWGCYCISSTKWGYVTHDVSRTLAKLKKKYTGS